MLLLLRESVRKGQQVKVKVHAIAGSKLSLTMREVDQVTGKDLKPRNAAAGPCEFTSIDVIVGPSRVLWSAAAVVYIYTIYIYMLLSAAAYKLSLFPLYSSAARVSRQRLQMSLLSVCGSSHRGPSGPPAAARDIVRSCELSWYLFRV